MLHYGTKNKQNLFERGERGSLMFPIMHLAWLASPHPRISLFAPRWRGLVAYRGRKFLSIHRSPAWKKMLELAFYYVR
jgi:hypothetical protein